MAQLKIHSLGIRNRLALEQTAGAGMIVLELQCYVLEYSGELSVTALRDFTEAR